MTTVYENAVVFTGDEHAPIGKAVAIDAGRILAVGDTSAVLDIAGDSAQRIDLEGSLLAPGFVEGHTHLMMLGQTLDKVQLRDCTSLEEIQERLALKR